MFVILGVNFTLTGRELKNEENVAKGWGEGGGGAGLAGLLERGDYFKFFRQRETIIGGRRLIEGRLLFEEIQYLFIYLFIYFYY